MALTAYLLAEGVPLTKTSVRTIALFGGHVPVARKRLLASLWGGVQVKDHYSLTEMFGRARECGVGGPWIFDPHIVPEVVHPRTFAPVREGGVGVLLLSSLYPFVQQMPLLRYHPHLARRCTEGSLALRVRPAPAADVPPYDSK